MAKSITTAASPRTLDGSWGVFGRWGDGRQSAEPPNKLLDDHCGTQTEMGDARLGIMGFVGTVRIMGKCWGRHGIPRGFAWAQWG